MVYRLVPVTTREEATVLFGEMERLCPEYWENVQNVPEMEGWVSFVLREGLLLAGYRDERPCGWMFLKWVNRTEDVAELHVCRFRQGWRGVHGIAFFHELRRLFPEVRLQVPNDATRAARMLYGAATRI